MTSRAARGVDQRRVRVVARREVRPVAVDDDEVRAFAGLDRADLCRRGRAPARRRASPSTARRAPAGRPGRSAPPAAGPRAASLRTCRAGCCTPRRRRRATRVMPRARISGTGAMPEPSFRLEPGQCSTLTSCSARSACSRSSTHTQCAAQRRGDAQADAGEVLEVAQPPVRPRTTAISSRDSDAWVCTSRPLLGRQAATASSSSSRARHGEARRERRAQPPAGRAVPPPARCDRLSSIDARVVFLQPPRRLRRRIHHALADRRAQAARSHRLEHDVGVVHRLHRQHRRRAARAAVRARPAAPPRAAMPGVCAASIGQTRRRSQSSSGRSSAKPRKSVWQRWMCVWINPGSTYPPPRVDRPGRASVRIDTTDRGDPPIADRHVARHDVEAIVHREDDAAADEQRADI